MSLLLFIGLVAFAVAHTSFGWVLFAVGLSAIFIAGRTNAIPRLRRWLARRRRQREADLKGLQAELRIKVGLEQAGLPVLHNVFLPHPTVPGALTQIDLLALSCHGIEVIEVKGHTGAITVDPEAADWPIGYPSGYPSVLHNPLWQNDMHVAAVQACIGTAATIRNIVILPEATLSFEAPTDNVFGDVPSFLEVGAPSDAAMEAWAHLEARDLGSDKRALERAHLKALRVPRTFDDPIEVRQAKSRARAKWIEGCQAELSAQTNRATVRGLIRQLLPDASPEQESATLRYAQSSISRGEIRARKVNFGQLVAARRRGTGQRWLPDAEFDRMCALERRHMGRGGGRRRGAISGTTMTRGELGFIVGVCLGLIGRLGQ